MRLLLKSSTEQPLTFLLVASSDHITALTGATPTVTLSKNGGAFASPAGTVSEIANGWYQVAANATDTGTAGALILHATAASGDPCDTEFQVVAFDPQDAVRLGLTAIPNVASGSAGALLVDGTGTAAISNASGKLLLQATQSGVTIPTVTTVGTLTTYTGNTLQTGDSFARLGAPVGASISADVAGVPAATLVKAVPLTGNTTNTVADCLNAARAQGFGKWILSGTTLTLYAADGTTVVRTFTLDSSTAPTQRV